MKFADPLCFLAGVILITFGIWKIYPPAGFIAGGVWLLVIAAATSRMNARS